MKHILIVGGGYAGFYAARGLERRLRRGEARVTVVDPRPYMTYQPFLPEVTAGSVEARHAVVPLRRHLRRTRVVAGSVTRVDHARRTVQITTADATRWEESYDELVVTAGAVTRTFPIPGLADTAIGLKQIEEAVAIRDGIITGFARAAALPHGPLRRKLLTVTFVGGGFTGVEGFGETLSLAAALLRRHPEIAPGEVRFHLVEATDRVLPEVSAAPGRWVVQHLRDRGGLVHLGTQLVSAVDGHVVLSDGQEYDSGLVVWAAGNAANPVIATHTDLPLDARGFVTVRPDLRVVDGDRVVPSAWAAGDDAAVPDLASSSEGARTVPNAQHAVRQGRLLARNLVAVLRGEEPRHYVHSSLGVVATLGIGHGLFQWHRVVVRGPLAWLMHRGYHVLAVPTWERKVRVLLDWAGALVGGRDTASLADVVHPRAAFVAGARGPHDDERAA
ncbi:NAD(P)/FAD-dependent oxidoreductase [Blastococcus sp. TF02A-30]|uniref:NAD(P)/FAD-dependent oxidoreductase n=1 Tax=Blastococcus sp. TF02A-30 TaxID=2250580 RepID=UPI000DEAE487|nr:FAD-dependent oxidoreductase [Blastococcus sp. TF02A-30]RBY89414.1 NAD(P)/FAD-dependent oxidoreductase [Blastococcus sp. TF02A-30]